MYQIHKAKRSRSSKYDVVVSMPKNSHLILEASSTQGLKNRLKTEDIFENFVVLGPGDAFTQTLEDGTEKLVAVESGQVCAIRLA